MVNTIAKDTIAKFHGQVAAGVNAPSGAWADLKTWIEGIHWGNPQRVALGQMAVDQIREGIENLAKLGHSFQLSQVDPRSIVPEEWPKMFYHSELGEQVVVNAEEAKKLESGWQTRPIAEAAPLDASPKDQFNSGPGGQPSPQAKGSDTDWGVPLAEPAGKNDDLTKTDAAPKPKKGA